MISVLGIVASKRKPFAVFHKIEQVSVRTREFVFAVHSKRIVPDDPAAHVKPGVQSSQFEFGCKVIADRQPECAIIGEHTGDRLHPLGRPFEVILSRHPIFIDIVLVADVEGGIGKGQMHTFCRQRVHAFDTVTAVNSSQ